MALDVAPRTVLSYAAGTAVDDGEWIVREDPSRPHLTAGRVSATDAAGVDRAVEAADAAFGPWAARSLQERTSLVLGACQAVREAEHSLADLLTRESGKVLAGSLGELRFSLAHAQYCADIAEEVLAPRIGGSRAGHLEVHHQPYGVVAAVTPWNAPLILAFLKVVPALLTGNTLVLKPSPLAPLAITEALSRVAQGLPPGVLNVVNGDHQVGARLTSHPLVRKVVFTGGSTVGRSILRTTAENLVPTVMELGGNDAAVFLDDVDLSRANVERAVLGSFLSAGQVCMAAKRVYVHSSRYEEFVDAYLRAADDVLQVGDPLLDRVSVGPLINRPAVERVQGIVEEAVAGGASARTVGGVVSPELLGAGYFLRPVVVTGAEDSDRIVREEQFGPVVPVLPFDDVDEVVRRVNADPLGLGASVWSADVRRAFDVGRHLEVGYTFINSHNRFGMTLEAPFGGVKGSGFGREYGPDGLLEYVQTHSLFAPERLSTDPQAYPTVG
ncbi:aldehyde dehydrogenase family protein [Nocardioides sp. W7]|uniref:aldehyde dehydrogenase family protein n=1 Tax=Nocardioides sp. W7 TaxID=2931390 RepID=UPI001FD048F9|nr:aldehyde dehydrogenase family protein [Nocardioides sp. W7]